MSNLESVKKEIKVKPKDPLIRAFSVFIITFIVYVLFNFGNATRLGYEESNHYINMPNAIRERQNGVYQMAFVYGVICAFIAFLFQNSKMNEYKKSLQNESSLAREDGELNEMQNQSLVDKEDQE